MKKIFLATVATVAAVWMQCAHAGSVKCNNDEVVSTFKDSYICEILVNCKALGVKNFEELQSLDDDQIKQRYEAITTQVAVEKQIDALGNAVGATIYRKAADIAEAGIIASKNLLTSVVVAPTDYNQNIKMYTCEANLTFDADNLALVVTLDYVNYMKGEGKTLMIAAMSTNNISPYEAFLKAFLPSMVAELTTHVQSTLVFTVQPTDIDDQSADPEYILKLKTQWVK
jgi:hypothetical protein